MLFLFAIASEIFIIIIIFGVQSNILFMQLRGLADRRGADSAVTPLKDARGLSPVPAFITPATKYLKVVIPAKAGIQEGTGCRIRHPGQDPGPA